MRYQTTKEVKSLAKGGVSLRARQPVTEQAFTPEHWRALLADGAVVAVEDAPEPEAEAETAVKSLADMDIDELKALADKNGVPYTWNIRAETLRERLNDAE